MNEHFVDIIGYENYYQISNLGRVKSSRKGLFFLSPSLTNHGYYTVKLCKGHTRKTICIHRLLAVHFIPNHENKPEVNHINGIKIDNRIENLEWVTHKENSHHAWRLGLKTAAMKGVTGYANKKSIPIICINTGETFASATDAAKRLKITRPNLVKVLKGYRPRVNGLRFKYKNAI